MTDQVKKKLIKQRFDGYLPVVIDVETSGVDVSKNALLEVAAVLLDYDEHNQLVQQASFSTHVIPYEGAVIDEKALEINRIDPYHPFRFAMDEGKALTELFAFIFAAIKKTGCRRAVLVGHNAHFDLSFILAAAKRSKIKEIPFHGFTVFDTATLGAVHFGKSVLAKAIKVAKIDFNKDEAHSALYDTQKTAELFCKIINACDR